MKRLLFVSLYWLTVGCIWAQDNVPRVRLAIVGLTHDHVTGFLPDMLARKDVQLAGIVETDQALIAKMAERYHLDAALFFPSLEMLQAKTDVEGVACFGSTFDHRKVVEQCAPLGIPVMVEKPLAVSLADAQAIAAAARKGGIQVYVNYETTWYPSTHAAYDLVRRQHTLGDVRKIVVHDGHEGPAHFVSPYFLAWLADPVLNGGGAVMDFGCYGADLTTWLMDGQRPTSVFAVLQQLQPDVYPKVDDEATIVLTYPRTQAIIQASWNWPIGRKDMEIYGVTGALRLPDRSAMFLRKPGDDRETSTTAPALASPQADSISHFAAIVRGQIKSEGLGSLETNLIVNEILEAVKESARTGKRVDFSRGAWHP
jgi:predicted dehydrogenase